MSPLNCRGDLSSLDCGCHVHATCLVTFAAFRQVIKCIGCRQLISDEDLKQRKAYFERNYEKYWSVRAARVLEDGEFPLTNALVRVQDDGKLPTGPACSLCRFSFGDNLFEYENCHHQVHWDCFRRLNHDRCATCEMDLSNWDLLLAKLKIESDA